MRWPGRRFLSGLAGVLIAVGLAPLAYTFWWERAHNLQPLSVPLALRRGESTSPYFRTDLDEDYQVDLYFLSPYRSPLNLDWKIVDENGAVLRGGSYREDAGPKGNDVVLDRQFRSKRGVRERMVVNLLADVQPPANGDTRLYVELPEEMLGGGYAELAARLWAAVVGGGGVIVLIVAAIRRADWRQSR